MTAEYVSRPSVLFLNIWIKLTFHILIIPYGIGISFAKATLSNRLKRKTIEISEALLVILGLHERLILNGEEALLAYCPPLPKNETRIVKQDDQGKSASCFRGYTGTWEIKDDKFYLKSIEGRFKLRGEPIFAYWFTGTLKVPRGKMLHYVDMVFASIYEEELRIKIANGLIIETKIIDNREK